MSQQPISIASLDPGRKARFQALTRAPRLSWPTFLLWLLVMTVYIGSDVLAVMGRIPLWAGMVANSVIGYLAFSVIHDSIHRAISTNTRVNDWIGQVTVLLGAPYVNLKLFRWGHILHHRFTSGAKDPDIVLHGPWWSLPFRWIFIDGFYFIHALRHGDKVSRPYLITTLWWAFFSFSTMAVLVACGYGPHLLMLWFIPSRMIFLTLGFSFFWLPHVPHDTEQEHNFTRATSVRLGHEWLLGPALQSQNFHLIHHLYPMTPFYNNRKVWELLEPELRKKDLAIQHGFAIRPTIYPAPNA
ncbi:fatty acid desaturase [Nevskia soli]|uniref:fatty acid desaturase n=1 Tax=Nevskia soli TaxID=418856 RepID=UPI0004A74089|nr:fatty acid desaturase [Nevskia soli]